jgi:hypothetical protein
MNSLLDRLFPLYWQRIEYTNAWRLCFEQDRNKVLLLKNVLRHLPNNLGDIEFFEDLVDERFIVLFTHDRENEGALQNEGIVLSILAETRGITFLGAEGARGDFNFHPYRSFPDRGITREIIEFFLRDFKIQPHEYAAIICTDPIFVWGIEDENLYLSAVEKYKTHALDYQDVIKRRAPVLFENLLSKMNEMSISIGGVCVTDYNFSVGHEWLLGKGIAHAGIRSCSSGTTRLGFLDSRLKNEPYDEQEAMLWEIFSEWKRPKDKHYKTS